MKTIFAFMKLLCFFLPFTAALTQPRRVVWSPATYGPDGPWRAITVQFGSPGQTIDAYPAGSWESLLFSSDECDNTKPGPSCYAADAGVYDPSQSDTSLVANYGPIVNETFYGTQTLFGDGMYYLDTLTLPGDDILTAVTVANLSTFVVSRGYRVLPNGTLYSAAVGNIALGSPNINQSFGSENGALLTGYMYEQSDVASSSYGLHIGSVSQNIPGSLYIGGYDQLRIVGPVSAQAYGQATFPIDLLDISIGVATGASPFNFTTKTGLLAQGNASIAPSVVEVEIDAKEPYLYLYESTCQAIAANLPVTFDPNLGLYLWNTKDPLYDRIVSSPTYLGFTFRANNSLTANFTINVPFKLLNLTLTAPLAVEPTSYFPCSLPTLSTLRLGRAFLQAAFVGVNWGVDGAYDGKWFLAQAPGPNLAIAPAVVGIEAQGDAGTVVPSGNTWLKSWEGFWEVGAEDGGQAANSSITCASCYEKGSKVELSRGAIVGICVGGAIFVCFAAGLAFWFRRRRRMAGRSEPRTVSLQPSLLWDGKTFRGVQGDKNASFHASGISELPGYQISELSGTNHTAEKPGYSVATYRPPVELDA